jgi:hypothetical protein
MLKNGWAINGVVIHGDEQRPVDDGIAVDFQISVSGSGRRLGDDNRAGDADGRARERVDLVVTKRGARPGD